MQLLLALVQKGVTPELMAMLKGVGDQSGGGGGGGDV
jgi:hypothetical protein